MFFLCVYHVSVLHVGPPQWHLLAALEAWSVPRPRVSSADSLRVGGSRGLTGLHICGFLDSTRVVRLANPTRTSLYQSLMLCVNHS